MEKCLFCDQPPGSEEHVFLSALGGRLTTRHATCQCCNGHFASGAAGKIDDQLAEQFIHVRCGIAIWSGRNGHPPSIPRAGVLDGGGEFDLAPGFIPILRAPRIPDDLTNGSRVKIAVRNEEDVRRVRDILRARGLNPEIMDAERVREKAPMIKVCFTIGGQAGLRSVAKTAAIGACVLYGNENANRIIEQSIPKAIRDGVPDISGFAGWDYSNEWPKITALEPHPRNRDATPSGFEHTLIISVVQDSCVAYVEFFGGFRFSVRLGASSGLLPKGLAINPRALRLERFLLTFELPQNYSQRHSQSLKDDVGSASKGIASAMCNVLSRWNADSHKQYYEQLAEDLQNRLQLVRDDASAREAVLHEWTEEVAAIEFGGSWSEKLGLTELDEDPTA